MFSESWNHSALFSWTVKVFLFLPVVVHNLSFCMFAFVSHMCTAIVWFGMLLLSLLVVRLCTRCITRYVESIKKYHSMVLGLPLLIFQCVWTRISARRVALNIYSLRSPQRMLCSNAGVKLPGENHDQVSNVITLSSMHSLSPMF